MADEATAAGDAGADTGAASAEDTGSAEGTEAAEGAEGGAAAKPDTPAEAKYKARLFGRDQEFTVEEMRQRLDDDYEWSFHGVAGKPLMQDGKPLTRKWRDIVRDVQMSKGAAEAARRSNEERKRFEQARDWGKDPKNTMAYLKRELGISNPRQFALLLAADQYRREQELVDLAQKDPIAHARAVREQIEQDDKEEKEAIARLEQQQRGEQERAQRSEQYYGMVTNSFKTAGVPYNSRTKEMADQVVSDYAEAGAQITFDELATTVRDLWHEEIFGYLDAKPDADLLKLFGDKRRERLRKAELEHMKGAKKDAAAKKPAPPSSNGNSREAKGVTEKELFGKRFT